MLDVLATAGFQDPGDRQPDRRDPQGDHDDRGAPATARHADPAPAGRRGARPAEGDAHRRRGGLRVPARPVRARTSGTCARHVVEARRGAGRVRRQRGRPAVRRAGRRSRGSRRTPAARTRRRCGWRRTRCSTSSGSARPSGSPRADAAREAAGRRAGRSRRAEAEARSARPSRSRRSCRARWSRASREGGGRDRSARRAAADRPRRGAADRRRGRAAASARGRSATAGWATTCPRSRTDPADRRPRRRRDRARGRRGAGPAAGARRRAVPPAVTRAIALRAAQLVESSSSVRQRPSWAPLSRRRWPASRPPPQGSDPRRAARPPRRLPARRAGERADLRRRARRLRPRSCCGRGRRGRAADAARVPPRLRLADDRRRRQRQGPVDVHGPREHQDHARPVRALLPGREDEAAGLLDAFLARQLGAATATPTTTHPSTAM